MFHCINAPLEQDLQLLVVGQQCHCAHLQLLIMRSGACAKSACCQHELWADHAFHLQEARKQGDTTGTATTPSRQGLESAA